MVSSGVVQSDVSNLSTSMNNYNSLVSDSSSSWCGTSFDSISSKASSFSSEYLSTISNQMNSFAEACDLYSQYRDIKDNLDIAKRNYNIAVNNKDNNNVNAFYNQINTLNSNLNTLSSKIQSLLSSASTPKYEVPVTTYTTSATAVYNSPYPGTSSHITCSGGAHIDGLTPAMASRISKLADRYYELTGENLIISSGSRTMEEQQALYNKYGSSRAAKPSKTAPHIAGVAVDIDTNQANFLAKNGVLKELGLSRPLLNWGASGGTNEPWHIELNEWRESGRNLDYVNSLTA